MFQNGDHIVLRKDLIVDVSKDDDDYFDTVEIPEETPGIIENVEMSDETTILALEIRFLNGWDWTTWMAGVDDVVLVCPSPKNFSGIPREAFGSTPVCTDCELQLTCLARR